MPLTTVVDPAGVWGGAPCTITTVVVMPPGLDIDATRLVNDTWRKATGFAVAVGDIVCLTHDSLGEIGTFISNARRGLRQVCVSAAAASGATSFTGYAIPQFRVPQRRFAKPATRSDMGITGDPVVYSDAAFTDDLDAAPANGVTVYGYIDGGGVEHTTETLATAASGVAWWIIGAAMPLVNPGPADTQIRSLPVLDAGRSNFGATFLNKSRTIQRTGTPPSLGSLAYGDIAETAIGASSTATNCLLLGHLVGVDTRTSPPTYHLQESPSITAGTDPTMAPIWSSRSLPSAGDTTVGFLFGSGSGAASQRFLGVRFAQIGVHCDNFTTYVDGSYTYRRPSTLLQVWAPVISGNPDFAVDCTLPDPFGDVRVVWANGTVHLTKRSDAVTPPYTGMILSGWSPLAPREVSFAAHGGVPIAVGLTRKENGACPYPLRGWDSPRNNILFNYSDRVAPYRRALIPSNVRLTLQYFTSNGYSSNRLTWQWARRNASTRALYDLIGSPTSVATPTAIDPAPQDGLFYDITITAPPAGVPGEASPYALVVNQYSTYAGIEYLMNSYAVSQFDLRQDYGEVNTSSRPDNGPLDSEGVIQPVTGDPYPLEVHPEDIVLWQPAANDADCSYVGHDGWRWPDDTRMPAVTKGTGAAASWSAGVLTITAMPGITWTGDEFVDDASTTPRPDGRSTVNGYAFRITCPDAGLSLWTPPFGSVSSSFYNNPQFGWQKSESGCPIACVEFGLPPITINCPKPVVSGSVDILIELWQLSSPLTTYGGVAQLWAHQRLTVTIP